MEHGIKFRPNKPCCPHLSGKVERSRKTGLEEFYPTVDLKPPAWKISCRNGSIIATGLGVIVKI